MAMQTAGETPKQTGTQAMPKVIGEFAAKNFGESKEVREFPLGKMELVNFGDAVIGRATLQPGWRWSESLKEIAQTESCKAPHFQYHISGVLRIKMDDGKEIDCKAGDVSLVPPGHDAWVIGDEPVVVVDFQGMANYAKPEHQH